MVEIISRPPIRTNRFLDRKLRKEIRKINKENKRKEAHINLCPEEWFNDEEKKRRDARILNKAINNIYEYIRNKYKIE